MTSDWRSCDSERRSAASRTAFNIATPATPSPRRLPSISTLTSWSASGCALSTAANPPKWSIRAFANGFVSPRGLRGEQDFEDFVIRQVFGSALQQAVLQTRAVLEIMRLEADRIREFAMRPALSRHQRRLRLFGDRRARIVAS